MSMPQINLWCVIISARQQPEEKSQVGLRLSQVCLEQDCSCGSQLTLEDGLLLSGHCEEGQFVFCL